MDFEDIPNQDERANARKNKLTLTALAVVFIAPVLFAYLAYFNGWFADGNGGRNKGEIIEEPWHIEDLNIQSQTFARWEQSQFMSKWNWLLVLDDNTCNEQCQINWFMLQQSHLGLAKNIEKNNYLLVLNQQPMVLEGEWKNIAVMQTQIEQGNVQLKNQNGLRGLNKNPMPSNAIYLVDPLGNIFMRYSLVNTKEEAPLKSSDLRSDISSIMRKIDVRTR